MLLVCAVPLLGAWEWLTAPDPDVAAGNQAFEAGEFRSALEAYERAATERGTAAGIELDKGVALYKLAETAADTAERDRLLERAEGAFRLAADTSSSQLKSAAYYNLGNAAFLRGRWPEAIDAYRKALRADQENDDARYNLELALRKLERNASPPQSGQGQPSQGGGQGQNGQPQDPSQGPRDDEPGQQGNPGAGQQGQRDQPGDQSQGQSGGDRDQNGGPGDQAGAGQQGDQSQGSGGDRDQARGQPAPGDIGGRATAGTDRSERDRKLDALENRSRDLRRRRLRRGSRNSGSRRFGVQKDW